MKYFVANFKIECETELMQPARELLSAAACEAGFEAFEDTDDGLLGYVQRPMYDKEALDAAIADYMPEGAAVSYAVEEVPDQNWNQGWEDEGFEPIGVSDNLVIYDAKHTDREMFAGDDGECDIVVSDVMMPGMHGDELCRRIKENNETSWLPVILLTAKTGRDFMIEGLALGADDYIAKPFDTAILASKVAGILTNRRRLSQYYMDRTLALVRSREMPLKSAPPQQNICPDSCENLEEAVLNPQDQAFVDKATSLVLAHLSDTDFNIDRLCRDMAMSRTLFYGRLKTLTGQNPQDFIRLIRLEQAAVFLKQGDTVLDVSVKSGFVNVKYFSTVFKKHFGVSPSKYL